MRRIVLGLLAMAAAQNASAEPVTPVMPLSPRKPADANVTAEQLACWARAVVADKAGDLDEAEDQYKKALAMGPLANAMWNLSDVYRRRENYKQALLSLEAYGTLVSTDAERTAAAKVAAAIQATPYRVHIAGKSDVPAVVFVDGVRVGITPLRQTLAAGKHVVDVIGSNGYSHFTLEAKPMETLAIQLHDHATPGNVVLSTSPEWTAPGGGWRHEDMRFDVPALGLYPAGHYDIPLQGAGEGCANIVFDAPKDGLVLVYVKAQPPAKPGGCKPLKTTVQKVVLP